VGLEVGRVDYDRLLFVMFEICAKVGDALSGGGLKLAEAIAEFNPLDDLGQPVLAVKLAPFLLRRHHQPEGHGKPGLAAQASLGFTTAASLVSEMMEARDERRLLRFQKQMAGYKLLIIDELGFVPLSKTGAELLFELISQRYERGATLITSNLPFDEWTETFGSERLTGALLDRLTHHVSILEMNGESYRLANSTARKQQQKS